MRISILERPAAGPKIGPPTQSNRRERRAPAAAPASRGLFYGAGFALTADFKQGVGGQCGIRVGKRRLAVSFLLVHDEKFLDRLARGMARSG